MNIRSRRALLGGALLVAGALGWNNPASAQLSRFLPGAQRSKPPTEVVVASTPSSAEARANARLDEFRVEMGLLADPLTFPWALTAHVNGSMMHVSGAVPDEATHKQVLKIVGENTKLAALDGITINPTLPRPVAAESPDALAAAVRKHLGEKFPAFSRSVIVTAKSGGQVEISGMAPSIEDKLNVSRSLQRFPGCVTVTNSLALNTVVRDGRTFHTVTADGNQFLDAEIRFGPGVNPGVQQPVAATPSTPAVKPAGYTTPSTTPSTPTVTPEPTPAKENRSPYNPLSRFSSMGTKKTTGVEQAKWEPAKAPTQLTVQQAQWVPSKPTSGVVPASAEQVTPAPTPAPAPRSPGWRLFGGRREQAAPAIMGVGIEHQLRQKIEASCGIPGRDIQVTQAGDKKLKLFVKMKNGTDVEKMSGKILSIPELVPYEVALNVTVDP